MSYRALIVALALVPAFVPGSYAQSPGGPEQEAQEAPATEGQPVPEAGQEKRDPAGQEASRSEQVDRSALVPVLQGVERAIRDLVATEDKEESKRKENREIRDLDAQEGMVLWAEKMFWATLATVLLTFAALIAILRTLHHTRRAADYAEKMAIEARKATDAAIAGVQAGQKAAEAAGETNRITIETAAIDRRPWIKIDAQIERATYIGHEPGKFHSGIKITLSNIGKTPAVRVFHSCELIYDGLTKRSYFTDLHGIAAKLRLKADTPLPKVGTIIFPNSRIRPHMNFTFDRTKYVRKAEDRRRFVKSIVMVAVIYQSMDKRSTYRTGAIYEVMRIHDDGMHTFISPHDDDFGTIKLILSPTGVGFID